MKDSAPLPIDSRPVVFLFANPSGLATSLTETLLANFCRVKIISPLKDEWTESIAHLSDNKAVNVLELSEELLKERYDYIIFLNRGLEKKYPVDEGIGLVEKLLSKKEVNTLFVLPFVRYKKEQRDLNNTLVNFYRNHKGGAGVVYIGQVLGPRVVLSEEDLLAKSIKDAVVAGKVTTSSEKQDLYPVDVSEGAKEIVRRLFSFGGVGQETEIFGQKSSLEELVKNTNRLIPSLQVKKDGKVWEKDLSKGEEREVISLNFKEAIKETIEWYTSHPPTSAVEKDEKEKPPKKETKKVEDKQEDKGTKLDVSKIELPQLKPTPKKLLSSVSLFNKKVLGVLLIAALLLILPYILMGFSGGALLVSKKTLLNGQTSYSRVANSLASASAKGARAELAVLTRTPLVGGVFEGSRGAAFLLVEATTLMSRAQRITSLGSEMFEKALADRGYDVSVYSEPISLELEALYRDLSFLESEYSNESGIDAWLFDKAMDRNPITGIRQKLLPASRVFKELPVLLGEGGRKTYLVLFQNNMELRPTGGFIGSFALLSFEKGRLIDINIQDVYSADGQLKGHVEPPEPIRDYLGEANWYLRDSNWDPDFPVSAQRAEWFLDKEIGVSVDGVVGIDLELARSLVRVTGPLNLEDFDKEVTAENLYEVTQYEVEKDFFPGSRRKSTFLTALTRELLNQLLNSEKEKQSRVALALLDSVEKKHVQIFLHNNQAQRAISDLGWSGAVYQPTCSGNCHSDYFGIVEANLGVNKANYFINRSASVEIDVNEDLVSHTLRIKLANEGNPALGNSARYEAYMRVFAPQESEFSSVTIVGPNSEDALEPEIDEIRGRKDAGVLVEIAPGQERTIVYKWESEADISFDRNGQYQFVWRKQAGTSSDPIQVTIRAPFNREVVTKPSAFLTQGGGYGYNTELSRDFAARIFW